MIYSSGICAGIIGIIKLPSRLYWNNILIPKSAIIWAGSTVYFYYLNDTSVMIFYVALTVRQPYRMIVCCSSEQQYCIWYISNNEKSSSIFNLRYNLASDLMFCQVLKTMITVNYCGFYVFWGHTGNIYYRQYEASLCFSSMLSLSSNFT